jgi:hypothetical protein
MTTSKRVLMVVLLLASAVACEAQWIAVAHAVAGRIERMEQQGQNGSGGYDVAVVIIEAPAQKVYDTAIQRIQAHADQVKIVKEDDKKRTVSFTNGTQTASLQANSLGEKITQLMVASTLDPAKPSTTSLVVNSIKQVCTEMKVDCVLEDQ